MLKGFSELERALGDFTEKLRTGRTLREAVARSVKPLMDRAAASAPRGSGALGRSIVVEFISRAEAEEVIARVGPGRPEGSHGILLELGTIYMTPRPFLGSAYEATQGEILDVLEIELLQILE